MYKRKYSNKLSPLSVSILKIYRNSSKNNNPQFLSLIKNWDRVIGKEYCKIVSPMKISPKKGTLIISSNRNFSTEAQYIIPVLLEKINHFYGYKAFKDIDFVFKNKQIERKNRYKPINSETKDKIEKIVCNIENDSLKESLERLGKSMASKGKIK